MFECQRSMIWEYSNRRKKGLMESKESYISKRKESAYYSFHLTGQLVQVHINAVNKKHSVICIEHVLCDDATQIKQKQNQKNMVPTFKSSHVSVGRQKCKQMNQRDKMQRNSIFYRNCKIFFKMGLFRILYFNVSIILTK